MSAKDTPPLLPATLEWSAVSKSGSRKSINDDSWLAFSSDINGSTRLSAHGTHSLSSHDLVFAVSDGMGGANAGNVASELLLENLSLLIPRTFKTAAQGFHPDYINHMQQAIKAVHLAVNAEEASSAEKKGMSATLALAWFTPENLYLANVGDSRIYLHRNNHGVNEADDVDGTNGGPTTTLLTQDHTFAWKKLNRGDISERDYRNHPRRAALYEAIGGGHPSVRVNVAAVPYQLGDTFLICSDGLIDGLWEKHIHSAFINNTTSTNQLLEALISRSVSNDGTDDTTAIIIRVIDSNQPY